MIRWKPRLQGSRKRDGQSRPSLIGSAMRIACISLLLANSIHAADWPQFRGPGGTAVTEETGLPTRWGPKENVRWQVELPGRGLSSAVVSRGNVYVTACTGSLQDRLHILCFDASTGKKRWERQLHATGNTLCHPKTSMAAATPATDGERIYALFATGDLVCFDAGGDLIWYRSLARDHPRVSNQVGMAASPILWNDLLLLPLETAGESFAAGLDKATGRTRWKTERPREGNWVTPLLINNGGREEVVFQSSLDVTAYDPATGRKHWTFSGEGLFPIPSVPSPAVGDGCIVLAGGAALKPGSDHEPPAVLWRTNKLRPAYASLLYYRGRVYALNNSAILLNCFAGMDGKLLWQQRLQGPFSASPVASDGKIYLVNEEGIATVLEASDRPRILNTNSLPETILATPALAEGAIFLRSDRHLICIAQTR